MYQHTHIRCANSTHVHCSRRVAVNLAYKAINALASATATENYATSLLMQ